MATFHLILLYSNIFILCSLFTLVQSYVLTPSESILDGETLISQGGAFKLGFFSPSTSSNRRYVGIWYNTIPVQTVVWVANRDSPLNDTSGVLKIGSTGSLVIEVNQTGRIIWSSNSSRAEQKNLVLELLESGNLALRDLRSNDKKSYLWQSFDYPGDTMLPGMKTGWNSKTGIKRYMTSWKSFDDPSTGDYTYGLELAGYIESVMRKGSEIYFRGGSWNGVQNSGSPEAQPDKKVTYEFVTNAEETYFTYNLVNSSTLLRLVLTQTSSMANAQRLTWDDKAESWVLQASLPRDRCDSYALCGAYGTCDLSYTNLCQCMEGFKPKSPQKWTDSDWSQGCERIVPVNCSGGDGFRKYSEVKLPQTRGSLFNTSMNLEECRLKCLSNCSCMAYANSDVRGGGSGCILWMTDLLDMRQVNGVGQDLYIRMAASELESATTSKSKKHAVLIASTTTVAGVFALVLGVFCIWKKINSRGGILGSDLDLPLYDLASITSATNNFSTENKLGEGGFGPVYKGILDGNEVVAIKRLSKSSIQGVSEFMNEVILISKLQHRNLVRILGCCVQKEEMMLVYEYVQNNSLDTYIFDEIRKKLLDWEVRYQIILGIARGLLYLHHDSRLRIIHRDLKAGNILLDHEMVPKISDFGMARIFKLDDTEERTKRVVGTYGYMSPEYMLDGRFSVKSDVYSFGVMVLEIISGKRNRSFGHPDHDVNLLGHAWRLWNEDMSIELLDASMKNSCRVQDVIRCINAGLLCVQKVIDLRPTMSSVLLMLSSENAVLPAPEMPGFYVERSTPIDDYSDLTDASLIN